MQHYKDSESIISRIKKEKKMEIKGDLLDMQMERVRLNTEVEMLEAAILTVTERYAEEMNLDKAMPMELTDGFGNESS